MPEIQKLMLRRLPPSLGLSGQRLVDQLVLEQDELYIQA